jgi:putative transposase
MSAVSSGPNLNRTMSDNSQLIKLIGICGNDSPFIHMLLSAPPHLAPAKLVQYIKGRSSRKLQEEFPELRKRYWGQHLWARGYFCATVGAVDEQTIKAYIENQTWDEDDQGFKITAQRALRRLYSRGYFRRLQPHPDFQSQRNLPALPRSF